MLCICMHLWFRFIKMLWSVCIISCYNGGSCKYCSYVFVPQPDFVFKLHTACSACFMELLLHYLSTIERFTFLICYLFCRFIWVSAFSATQNCSYNWSSFPLHLLTCTLLQLLELPATVTSLHLYLQVYVAIQHQISIKI